MSSSGRLAKLKRGTSMVSDVNRKIKPVKDLGLGKNDKRNMVDSMTILTWHEQRINRIEDEVATIKENNNKELINSLIDTIEALDQKLNLLSEGYNTLLEKNEDTVKTEVKKEFNTVKLNTLEN